jgi:hypothetical protein
VLATLAVILWAYTMYALISFVFHRQGGYVRSRSRWRKLSWFTLMGGAAAGLSFIVWCCLSPNKHDQRLKLAGFLGTVYAEGWPDRVDAPSYPPVKTQTSGTSEQPAYALLHPETPVSQIEPEKKLLKPRPVRVAPKKHTVASQDKAAKSVKVAKTTAPQSKKDRLVAKSRAKKKNRTTIAPISQGDAD